MTLRSDVLHEGAKLTSDDRDAIYGDPKINLACAGAVKQVLRRYHEMARGRPIGPGEWEGIDLAVTKLSRIVTGSTVHKDSYVDGATYLAIAYECAQHNMQPRFVVGNMDDEMKEALKNAEPGDIVQGKEGMDLRHIAQKFAPRRTPHYEGPRPTTEQAPAADPSDVETAPRRDKSA